MDEFVVGQRAESTGNARVLVEGLCARVTAVAAVAVVPVAVSIVVLIGALSATDAGADGAFISTYGKDIVEPEQKAFISYDPRTETEELIIQPSFRGNTRDFAWIVAVPALPELETSHAGLFLECARLTRPITRLRDEGSCGDSNRNLAPPPPDRNDTGISIYDERIVGIFQTLTVGAQNASALTDSLSRWGYLHERNNARTTEALQFYVDRSWFFVALRVDSTQFESIPGRHTWYGGLDPLSLRFKSSEMVYPMRISAISADELTEVLIYVSSDHRVSFPLATTEYAHRIVDGELDFLRDNYPLLAETIRGGPRFLTKLRRTFSPEEMDGDIVVTRTDTDAEFRQVRYTGFPFSGTLMLAVAYLLLVRRRRSPQGVPNDEEKPA